MITYMNVAGTAKLKDIMENTMKVFKNPIALCVGLFASSMTFAADIADVIYKNGAIYTVNDQQKWAQAVAIDDGKFIGVGSNAEVMAFKGANTKVVDLQGKFVMPGLVDEHIHPDMGADNYLNIFVSASDSWDTIAEKIRAFRHNNPEKKWLYGGTINWLADNSEPIAGSDKPSNRSTLDAIVDDRPIALWDQGAHAMLLNTMALEELGITKDTPAPSGGIFVKDADGELTGVIRETAATLVTNALDNVDDVTWTEKGMKPFLQEMSTYGVTALNDAYGTTKNLDAFRRLENNGQLNHRIHVSLVTPLEYSDPQQKKSADILIRNHKAYASELILPYGIKYIMDGSAAGKTAAMIDPFHGTNFNGDVRYSFEDVEAEMQEYAKLGLAFKAHAIGDRAIRGVLDIYDRLPEKSTRTPNSVSHGTFIHPDDIKRFGETGVVFEASPALWFPNDGAEIIEKDIGDRVKNLWPIKELIRTDAIVSYGSDWTVSLTPNPWLGFEAIITREVPGGSEDTLYAKHAVELSTAIEIFTINGAKAIGLGDKSGSIEVGKYADMIVLDRNLFKGDVRKIHQTQVEKTIFNGKEIYSK